MLEFLEFNLGRFRSRTKGAGGMLLASTNWGMLVQVLIQCDPSCLLSAASIARPLTAGENKESVANATERSDV